MIRMFRNILTALLLLLLLACTSSASTSKAEIKRMGIFVSNFTEVGLYDFDIQRDGDDELIHLGDPDNMSELIRFGISHNVINNPKSTIRRCTRKNCEYGSSTMKGSAVAASVRRYFDLPIKNQSILNDSPEAFYDGEAYHIEPSDWKNDTIYYAEVQDVTRSKGVITMEGELYNLKDKSDRPATFTATAKPHTWNKKSTWAILSLRVYWR